MAYSQHALCVDCKHGYTRRSGKQVRCAACQAESEQRKAREYKAKHRLKRGGGKSNLPATRPDEYFYTIVNDPLQPEWHGRITYQSVTEMLHQATFSEGTVLRQGRVKFKVAGATAPYPFMLAVEAQRLVEVPPTGGQHLTKLEEL